MASSSDCPFCGEEDSAGTRQAASFADAENARSSLIRRTDAVDVRAGLGALALGYMLVIPRWHVLSCGALPDGERVKVFNIAWEYAERIRHTLACQVVAAEHGSSGSAGNPSGACIAHAHLHLFPVPLARAAATFVVEPSRSICGTRELAEAAAAGRNYYYCSWDRHSGYLCENPRIGSQHARRIWARLLDRADHWDWALFPENDAREETAKLFSPETSLLPGASAVARGDRPSGDANMEDTLRAYAEGADAYAERTRNFPDSSTLPGELRDFATAHGGLVLDAGAGAGRDAQFLASLGNHVIALDATHELLAHIPDGPNLARLRGDLRQIPLRDTSVGRIWCSGVLLHMEQADLLACLREFARILEPGGVTQLSVKEGTGRTAEPVPGGRKVLRHIVRYRADDIIPLARRAGLTVDRAWTVTDRDSSEVQQRWLKLRLIKVPS